MAKLTGQFTTPRFDANNNKTHEAFLHAVVFVFTSDTTKVTRETDAKGKYSFDLANGEYEVSVYLKGNTDKDRFDMRAGEKFSVTATTKADALEKWLQVIGAGGKDELATYYENLLAQMQKVANDFKDDTQSTGTGKWVKESLIANMMNAGDFGVGIPIRIGRGSDLNSITVAGNYAVEVAAEASDIENLPDRISTKCSIVVTNSSDAGTDCTQWVTHYNNTRTAIRTYYAFRNRWSEWAYLYTTENTTVDSNGNIKAASPIIKLFSDHIESNDSFKEKPSLDKLSTGVYKISNTLGLAKEGWYIETPKDKNGLPYFMVDWEQDEESQDVIIRVFKKKLDLETLDFVNGEPVDIGKDQRWIDLRFHEEEVEENAEQ